MGSRTRRLLERDGPDVHTIVFAAMLVMVGLVLVVGALVVLSRDGWDGRLSLKASQADITLPEALVTGGISLGLGGLVLRAGWPRRRTAAKETKASD